MTRIRDLEIEIKGAIHDAVSRFFDQIEKETGGTIQVEDLTIETFSVSISVTIKPREEISEAEKEEGLKKAGGY